MKTTQFPFLIACSLFSVQLFAQNSPCLCFEREKTACTTTRPSPGFNHSSRTVSLSVLDNPASLERFAGARYKAFWIFGDGNFAFKEHLDSLSDVLTLQQTYTYRRAGRYGVEASLTEKKSNTKPPVRDRRIITIDPTIAPGPGSPFVQTLTGNPKTADILPSEDMRPHEYETAFAVSAPKNVVNTGIYFFYNSQVESATGNLLPVEMHKVVDVNLPDYAGVTFDTGQTITLNNALGQALRRSFRNYIYVPITEAQVLAMPSDADFTEYRIFPILKTIWKQGLPNCRFLTVVVGNTSAVPIFDIEREGKRVRQDTVKAPSSTDFYTEEKLESLELLGSKYFSDFSIGQPIDYDSVQNGVFIRGMFEKETRMLGSIDPNELEVISVCPRPDGKYTVKMRLQVCNEGILGEQNFPVHIKDLTGGSFNGLEFITEGATINPALQWDAATHTWSFKFPGKLDAVVTASDLAANDTRKAYEPQCKELYFTLVADGPGVQKLLTRDALELCVDFVLDNTTQPVCTQNFPIYGQEFTPVTGYRCLPPETGKCGILCILLIVCLIGILVWWFMYRNDNN